MDTWREIPGCNGQTWASNTGRVITTRYAGGGVKELGQYTIPNGYITTCLYMNGESRMAYVHKLVALAFLPNPEGKTQVNHKDGNKKNNHLENLEWVTPRENTIHALDTGLCGENQKQRRAARAAGLSTISGKPLVRRPNTPRQSIDALRRSNMEKMKPVIAYKPETGERIRFASVGEAERKLGTKHISTVLKGKRTRAKGYYFEYDGR